VGCFTRLASIAGMGLILLYYVCNPPMIGLYYSIPSEGNYLIVNKNIVEMAALFVLLFFPTGRISGLDYLIHKWRNKPSEALQ
jgi:thiosulfate dehydrogenase [quinone] large subunit